MKNNLLNIKNNVRNLITNGNISGAINYLINLSHNFSSQLKNDISIVSGCYKEYEYKYNLGTVEYDNTIFSKTAKALIDLLENASEESIIDLKKIFFSQYTLLS